MWQALCVASSYMIVGIVAQTHAPAPLRIPFNSNTTPGLSSDIDGPWPTVYLTYGPDFFRFGLLPHAMESKRLRSIPEMRQRPYGYRPATRI